MAALSGAFIAVSDDASQVFYNSAAAVKVRRPQAGFTYARLFTKLDEANFNLSQFSYHQPISKNSALGVGWGSFNSTIYNELTLAVSFSQDFEPWLGSYEGDLAAGLTVRYLSRKFDLDVRTTADPVFNDGSRTTDFALDLHLYSVPDPAHLPGLSLGLAVRGLNQPNIGYRDREVLPAEIIGGLAYRIGIFHFPLDLSARDGKITPHLGGEASLWEDRVKARAGYDRRQFGTGFGFEHAVSPSFSLLLDYAFLWPLKITDTSGSHRATLGVKF